MDTTLVGILVHICVERPICTGVCVHVEVYVLDNVYASLGNGYSLLLSL